MFKKTFCSCLVHNRWSSLNSKGWLERRSKDRYVELAKTMNYRCRSAYKLLEIDERHRIIRAGMSAVDLGAAPGSWTQVLVRGTNADGKDLKKPKGHVIAVDRLPIYPIENATILSKTDFTLASSKERVLNELADKKVNLVVSDMAPNATGVRSLDQDAIFELAMAAVNFAIQISAVNAACLVKIWDGGSRKDLENELAKFYAQVHHIRPKATQSESTELFLLARGFKNELTDKTQ